MDPSKFFNRKINIRNPKTPYQKGKFVDESQNYSNRISSRITQSPLTKSLFSLRNKVFQIENLLNGIFNLDKKRQEQNKKIKTAEVPDKKPKTKGPQIFGNIIQRPKTGALDLIKDFVTFTFLGWLFTRIQPLLGGLTKLAPLLEGMAWFIGGTLKNMVDIFSTFLKLGFDAKEKFDSMVGSIKGDVKGIDKAFDETLTALKGVFGGTIELANSFLAVSVKEDELNAVKTQLAKSETVDNVPAMPTLPGVDAPRTPQTTDPFPKAPTRPGMVQGVYTGGIIRGYNEGGQLNQGRIDPRTPVTRGVETQKREAPKPKPTIQPQKTAPGKDVGGDKKIKELYDQKSGGISDFIPLPSFFRSDKKSGFAALMGASEEYKKPMTNDIFGIGNMMGASVDSALGQKIEKKSYTQFADGIKYLVNYGRTQPEEFAKLDLEDMVRKIVEPKVNMAINRIQEEINKKSAVEPAPPGPGDGGGGGAVSGNEYERAFLDLLAHAEGTTKSYGTLFGGSVNSDLAAGNLTVQETIDLSNSSVGGTGVLGRYQFKATTLQGLVRNRVLSLNEKFTPEKQDQAAIALARGRGVDPSKPLTVRDMYRLGGEWASIEGGPQMRKGGSYGYGGKSQIKYTAEQALQKYNQLLEQVRTVSTISVKGGTLPGEKIGSRAGMRLHPIHGDLRIHYGNDYPMPAGTLISSVVGGEVVYSGFMDGYGNTIDVRHSDGSKTRYTHLQNIRVKRGQKVSTGMVIGTVGSTGGSTGPHLHFEYFYPNGNRETNSQKLNNIANRKFRFGGNVRPTPTQKPTTSVVQTSKFKPTQGSDISYSNSSKPNLPVEKYASYNQPELQESLIAIQPIIFTNQIPVPISSGTIAFSVPVISNSTSQLA